MRLSAPPAALAAALCGLVLVACKPAPQAAAGAPDLVSQVLFTATGAFDAQAQDKARVPGGRRRAAWIRRVPLEAARVSIDYASDARPMTWMLQIDSPRFTAQDLAGPGAHTVRTAQGEGLRPGPASRLKDTLILRQPHGLKILTRSYATQVEPTLLGAFASH